jgi:hypothetical protein
LDGKQFIVSGLTQTSSFWKLVYLTTWVNAQPPTFAESFDKVAAVGTAADFSYAFTSSLVIDIRSDGYADGRNGFYVATAYEN